jgi:hypothetical protein
MIATRYLHTKIDRALERNLKLEHDGIVHA